MNINLYWVVQDGVGITKIIDDKRFFQETHFVNQAKNYKSTWVTSDS